MTKIPCTVGILTHNSAATLPAALASVKDFAEVILCDGASLDGTVSIAERAGARVIKQDPKFLDASGRVRDFSGVRNQMLAAASNPWFFYLDSDELMTKELEEEISLIISGGHPPAAFWVPRKYLLNGEVVDCAATYPTRQVRFFHRDAVTVFVKTIHERIGVREGAPVLSLKNFMLVPFNSDSSFHRRKWQHYIELEVVKYGKISFFGWFGVCLANLRISLLYGFRYIRNLFFCRGKRLPWRLEWERHMYHINTCRRFWKLIWES